MRCYCAKLVQLIHVYIPRNILIPVISPNFQHDASLIWGGGGDSHTERWGGLSESSNGIPKGQCQKFDLCVISVNNTFERGNISTQFLNDHQDYIMLEFVRAFQCGESIEHFSSFQSSDIFPKIIIFFTEINNKNIFKPN